MLAPGGVLAPGSVVADRNSATDPDRANPPCHTETPTMNPIRLVLSTRAPAAPRGAAHGNPAHGNPADDNLASRRSAARRSAARRSAARRALWVLGPVAVAVPESIVLGLAGAGGDWIGAVWLFGGLWAIAASLVQALWQGLRHGDWSAFAYCDLPGNDDDFDYTTRSGEFVFMQIQAGQEALMRDGDRLLHNHDHGDSRP